jgi:LacI family transcriptional regulator
MTKVRNKTRTVTLADVAAVAKVSVMTVSNIVNGKWHQATPETRKRVEEAISQLNYRPTAEARRLRLRQSFSIGMVIVDENPAFLTDPFICNVVAGLANHLAENGYSLVLHGVNPRTFQDSNLFISIQTDALCVLSSGTESARRKFVKYLDQLRQPLALIQEKGWRAPDACLIRQDDFGGARMIATHLLEEEAKSFVMLVPKVEWSAINERIRGVKEVLEEAGLLRRFRLLVCEDEGYDSVQKVLTKELDSGRQIDALIGSTDQIALAALHLLKAKNISVPRDILVTGFNAFDASRLSDPPLTTIHSPAYEMGHRAGEVLIERLSSGSFARREVVLPVELRLAESSQR